MRRGLIFIGTAFAGGIGVATGITGLVFLTGSTFGQRCAKMFPPADAIQIEHCVADLSAGKPASVGRNPKGEDPQGLRRNDEHAVPSETSADAQGVSHE